MDVGAEVVGPGPVEVTAGVVVFTVLVVGGAVVIAGGAVVVVPPPLHPDRINTNESRTDTKSKPIEDFFIAQPPE